MGSRRLLRGCVSWRDDETRVYVGYLLVRRMIVYICRLVAMLDTVD